VDIRQSSVRGIGAILIDLIESNQFFCLENSDNVSFNPRIYGFIELYQRHSEEFVTDLTQQENNGCF
jgi:hypothetical protein